MDSSSYISNAHPVYIESLYKNYKTNPDAIDSSWRRFFEGFDFAFQHANGDLSASNTATKAVNPNDFTKEFRVFQLIDAYRTKGHLLADINPLNSGLKPDPQLELAYFGLEKSDLNKPFIIGNELGLETASLREIIDRLKRIYCGSIGIEYGYITDDKARKWLEKRLEDSDFQADNFDIQQKKQILESLNKTTVFEEFLQKRYGPKKRFSIEGGDAIIPAITALIDRCIDKGTKEVAIGMAHRGRLNVLLNIMGKKYEQVFNEFEGNVPEGSNFGDGDVIYHLGYANKVDSPKHRDKNITVSLLPNPSHLESVNAVVQGFARAKADAIHESDYKCVLPILIHGDAAIAGQGVVYEVVQMSQLEGYHVGGTVHFVINNQIGFTTDSEDARSSHYCTGVAGVVEAPVFHVNGEDVEAVVRASELAAEYRQAFHTDVFINILCYRRRGHNEGEAPAVTQPLMYKKIAEHPSPKEVYAQQLIARKDIDAAYSKKIYNDFWAELQDCLDKVRQNSLPYEYPASEDLWKGIEPTSANFEKSPVTGISAEKVAQIMTALMTIPAGFTLAKQLKRVFSKQEKLLQTDQKINWSGAELLAYASILLENNNVRMSGQDVKRGTFSHRHAVIYDAQNANQYNRLSQISDQQGSLLIHNSLLSEFAVLGFEFGYSLASPHPLVIWEAQFGDFANGAQTIIDQYITSSDSKWMRSSGLVMLLPHGYEGMGPEHSSARLERYLNACGENNISVVNITTPANFFHVIRRQQHRPFRRPLVVMSPKWLFGYSGCVSTTDEIAGNTHFKEILDDPFLEAKDKKKVKKILLCSGKFYYELAEKQAKENRKDVAIIRLEQLYPLDQKQLEAVLQQYPKKATLTWIQEESANMGALRHIMYYLQSAFGLKINYISRKISASPATGYSKQHKKEQQALIEDAFA